MLNVKQKRLFVCTLMAALLLSMAAASFAHARTEDIPSPPAVDENGQPSADSPTLIMTLDGDVTAPEDLGNQTDQPNLYHTQDSPTAIDDNSTRDIAQEETTGGAEENQLVTVQNYTDSTPLIVGCAGIFAAVIAIGAFVVVRKRTAN